MTSETQETQARGHARRGKSGLRQMQKDLTRKLVTDAALKVFDERGFAAATMDEIATEASLNRGTIYLHFSNKAEILQTAINQMTGLRPLYEQLSNSESRSEREAAFELIYDFWTEEVAHIWIHVREAAAMDAGINQWLVRFIGRYSSWTQDVLEQHGVERELARARAFLLQNMWVEFIYRQRDGGSELNRRAVVTALIDLYETARTP
ncbi:MAG: TetR family transcriptional regulator [Pseudonocardiaceae bacterium]|nr:TetR family transcriptional regulator [Pseudonocardiaceae bacterium]